MANLKSSQDHFYLEYTGVKSVNIRDEHKIVKK